jgi:SPP1 family predicted phage head-tail adaptor
VKAGKLDRRLTLLQRVAGAEQDSGEASYRWAPLATVWAEKLEVRDADRVAALAVGVVITLRFRVRWSATARALKLGDRVRFDDVDYSMSGDPKEVGRREGLELTVARVVELAADGQ